jgi:hypothetical protein
MSAHQRRVIREAIAADLVAASLVAAGCVHDNPSSPRTKFPALVIEDDIERQSVLTRPAGPGRVIERRYSFSITVEVQQAGTGYAATRDDLCGAVEARMAALAIVGVKSIVPTGWQATNSMSHEFPITVGQQSFEALYYTAQGAPSTPL